MQDIEKCAEDLNSARSQLDRLSSTENQFVDNLRYVAAGTAVPTAGCTIQACW
jgi:hypothetical protein